VSLTATPSKSKPCDEGGERSVEHFRRLKSPDYDDDDVVDVSVLDFSTQEDAAPLLHDQDISSLIFRANGSSNFDSDEEDDYVFLPDPEQTPSEDDLEGDMLEQPPTACFAQTFVEDTPENNTFEQPATAAEVQSNPRPEDLSWSAKTAGESSAAPFTASAATAPSLPTDTAYLRNQPFPLPERHEDFRPMPPPIEPDIAQDETASHDLIIDTGRYDRIHDLGMLDDILVMHFIKCFSSHTLSVGVVDSLDWPIYPIPERHRARLQTSLHGLDTLLFPIHFKLHWTLTCVAKMPGPFLVADCYNSLPGPPEHDEAVRERVTNICNALDRRESVIFQNMVCLFSSK
jgi:hypothetical protein